MDPTTHVIAFGLGALAGALGAALIGRILVSILVDEVLMARARTLKLMEEVNRLESERDARSCVPSPTP